MIYQWGEYSSVPQTVRDIVASKVALLDYYILMQTGEQEYTALVYNPVSKECVQYRFYRMANYGTWSVETMEDAEWAYQVGNEYYVYSNMDAGAQLDLPVNAGMTAHATAILSITLIFAILFKGVLFPCLLGCKRKEF